jgi:hypothetical protein
MFVLSLISILFSTIAWDCPIPVAVRYMRIRTRPFLNQVYSHTTSKVVSSFVPHDTPALSMLQDTVYELMENKTQYTLVSKDIPVFLLRHFAIQAITHEVNDLVHEIVNDVQKMI